MKLDVLKSLYILLVEMTCVFWEANFSSIRSRLNALFYETDLFEDKDQTDMYRLIILNKIG